jgi:two-component system, LytTR family, response regulator
MSSIFTYAIIEDALDVCDGIKLRMQEHTKWQCSHVIHDIISAKHLISGSQPKLLFMDWSIKGGSTFELLDYLKQACPNYKPYIIYFTAFQSDEPQIPVDIVNIYKANKYLVKPIWAVLSQQLPNYLAEAEQNIKNNSHLIIKTLEKGIVFLPINNIVHISVLDGKIRSKIIYTTDGLSHQTKGITMDDYATQLTDAGINFFRANKRENIVTKNNLINYDKPFLNYSLDIPKIKVSVENYANVLNWLAQ